MVAFTWYFDYIWILNTYFEFKLKGIFFVCTLKLKISKCTVSWGLYHELLTSLYLNRLYWMSFFLINVNSWDWIYLFLTNRILFSFLKIENLFSDYFESYLFFACFFFSFLLWKIYLFSLYHVLDIFHERRENLSVISLETGSIEDLLYWMFC